MQRKVSLFVPCFVDQLLPEVAVDTIKVLRRIGYEVEFLQDQTCCGQPAFNTGYWNDARPCAEKFLRVFGNAEVVVCPSGSCTTMVRSFYPELLASGSLHDDAIALGRRTFELSEFLVKVAGITDVGATFPYSVTYHASCHGLRELHLRDEPLQLLRKVSGLKLVEMLRSDECCGFGGTFATKFESISVAMGESKAESIAVTGAEFVTAIDSSCLLHVQGVLGKQGAQARTIHLASILAREKS
jgi:L-lactate dehydrogenase complex protein LldE